MKTNNTITLDDFVKVKLTSRGREILEDYKTKVCDSMNRKNYLSDEHFQKRLKSMQKGLNKIYFVDDESYLHTHLSDLFVIFGKNAVGSTEETKAFESVDIILEKKEM